MERDAVMAGHGQHLAGAAPCAELPQQEDILRPPADETVVVGRDYRCIVRDHDGAVLLQQIDLPQVGECQSVAFGIGCGRGVVHHHRPGGIQPPVGRHVDIGAVRAVDAGGVDLLREVGGAQQRVLFQLRHQQRRHIRPGHVGGGDMPVPVQQKDAAEVVIYGQAPQQVFVHRVGQKADVAGGLLGGLLGRLHDAHQTARLRCRGGQAVGIAALGHVLHHSGQAVPAVIQIRADGQQDHRAHDQQEGRQRRGAEHGAIPPFHLHFTAHWPSTSRYDAALGR